MSLISNDKNNSGRYADIYVRAFGTPDHTRSYDDNYRFRINKTINNIVNQNDVLRKYIAYFEISDIEITPNTTVEIEYDKNKSMKLVNKSSSENLNYTFRTRPKILSISVQHRIPSDETSIPLHYKIPYKTIVICFFVVVVIGGIIGIIVHSVRKEKFMSNINHNSLIQNFLN